MSVRKLLSITATFCVVALCSPVFAAEDEGPRWDKGPVWVCADIKTKYGHFDDYMKYLDTDWKSEQEAYKKAGRILDYKVFIINEPRNNEPDISLCQMVKNMAEFDRTTTDDYGFAKQVYGSLAKSNKEASERDSIRTIMGTTTLREATLK